VAYKRIIPNFLLIDGEFYTSKKFKNHIYIGEPRNILSILHDKGVDELLLTPKGYTEFSNLHTDVMNILSLCNVPVSIQGGVETALQAKKLYESGVEKIFFHSEAFQNDPLYEQVAASYGKQAVGISLVIRKGILDRKYQFHSMRERGKISSQSWHKLQRNLQKHQFIEIILNDLSSDGTYGGWAGHSFIDQFANYAIIPACGIKSYNEIINLLEVKNVVAVAASSLFSYSGKNEGVLINYPSRSKLRRVRTDDNL